MFVEHKLDGMFFWHLCGGRRKLIAQVGLPTYGAEGSMRPKFKLGQSVLPAHPRRADPDTYVVVQVLPETSHEPQYRIKAASSGVECVVRETQIKGVRGRPNHLRASLPRVESERMAHVVWC